MNIYLRQVCRGVVSENPTFVLMLGMCPTLAVTTGVKGAIGMGISTMIVLILSNMLVSLMRNIIPEDVRIPAYIVIVSAMVTIISLLMQAYCLWLYQLLGVYVPLIVVNCIILGRADSFAAHNTVAVSICDGIGMGIGFTFGLTVIGTIREVLGKGTLLGIDVNRIVFGGRYIPVSILVLAPGAFFVMAIICAIRNYVNRDKSATGCSECGSCCGFGRCNVKG